MKLESVKKVLIIKVEVEELRKYITALNKVITDFQDGSVEINELKIFSIELAKILHSARDW